MTSGRNALVTQVWRARLPLAVAALCLLHVSAAFAEDFPLPDSLRPAVGFWKRVYLEASTDGGLVHDSRHLGVVYESIRFDGETHGRKRQKIVDAHKKRWRAALQALARKPPATPEEARGEYEQRAAARLRGALGREPTAREYASAARRIRFQLGQRDKFLEGLLRSGAYDAEMRAILASRGVPEDLAVLPHVESSFNVHAYSKYGAAGAWQFMRTTGRRYLRIDYTVDERLDPIASTEAAARLLRTNYDALGSWPLAITAYNHGRAGIQRAKRRAGTDDIGVIVEKYQSRRFGFASRNFYAQFMAAREIVSSYESYFGPLARTEPEPVDVVVLPFYTDVKALSAHLNLSPDVIQHYNPALRPPVFRGIKRIPQGYELRVPAGVTGGDSLGWLAAIPEELRHGEQQRSRYYQVRRGDTLGVIARRNRTSIQALVATNNLPSRHRIYAGQVLELPGAPAPTKTARAKPKAAPRRTAKAAAPPARVEVAEVARATPPKPAAPPPAVPPVEPLAAPTEIARVEPERAPQPAPLEAPETADDDVAFLTAALFPPGFHGPPLPTRELPEVAAPPAWLRVEDGWITVGPLETLGHFAEWLQIPTQQLRNVNRLGRARTLRLGQRLELDFSNVAQEDFSNRRLEYHKSIEEDFFGSYRVAGTKEHVLQRGENLWDLAHETYAVPIWLLHAHNPEMDLSHLVPGARLRIPVVEPL